MSEQNLAARLLQTVRKHLHGFSEVGVVDLGHLLELAHALGRFGSEQVALAGMHPKQFSGAGDFEAFGGAAMRLEFLFRFRSVAWHCFVNPLAFLRSS
jgi:hypothetical protein